MVAIFDADRPAVLYQDAVNEAAGSDMEVLIFLSGMQEGDRGAEPLLTADRGLDRAHTALSYAVVVGIVRQARFLEGADTGQVQLFDSVRQRDGQRPPNIVPPIVEGVVVLLPEEVRQHVVERPLSGLTDGVLPAGIVPDLATSIDHGV